MVEARWNVSGFIRDLTRQRWINFNEKKGNLCVGERFSKKKKEKKKKEMKGEGLREQEFIKDIDYIGLSKGEEKNLCP